MRNTFFMVAVAAVYGVLSACTSTPTETAESVENTFALADENANGVVDVEEYRDRMIVIFLALDEDKDGYLIKSELPNARSEALARADRDGDEELALREYLVFVMPEFWRADINGDNVLSLVEVTTANQRAAAD